jgi:hypothetical protein
VEPITATPTTASMTAALKKGFTFGRSQARWGDGWRGTTNRLNFSFFRLLLRPLFFQRLLGFLLAVLFHILGLGHLSFLLSYVRDDARLSYPSYQRFLKKKTKNSRSTGRHQATT